MKKNKFKINFTYDGENTNEFKLGSVTLTVNEDVDVNFVDILSENYKNPVIVNIEKIY